MHLSHSNLVIVIAASSALASLLLAYLLYRTTRFLRRKHVPLPPVQPLSHHRQQRLAKFNSQPSEISLIANAPPTPASADSASSCSLLPQLSPSEHSFPPKSPDDRLTPPFARHPRLRSASSSPSRPTSIASQYTSRSNRSTLRGMPHGPHSQIQIVLPMPLGSSIIHPESRSSLYETPHKDRRSLVDQWVPVAQQHTPQQSTYPNAPPPLPRTSTYFASSLSPPDDNPQSLNHIDSIQVDTRSRRLQKP